MQMIKGSGSKKKLKPHQVPRRRKDDPPLTEATEDDVVTVKLKKKKGIETLVDTESQLPAVIRVKQKGPIQACVPSSVWRQGAFNWQPRTFAAESERLNDKFVESEFQDNSLRLFTKDPTLRMIYGVSGNPSDSKAKYFAAHLVDLHIQALGFKANPVWYPLYEGFSNPLIDNEDLSQPTMIIMTNLTPNATNLRLSKARDIIEKFADIPRIVVIAGMDPMSFLSTKLFVPINGLAYFSETMVKQRVEIMG